MSNERHAAVLLHAMSAEDRDWIMGQLSEGHRTQLAPMLSELSDLGIPRQQELLLQLQDRAAAPQEAARVPVQAPIEAATSPQARVGRASIAQLKAALLHESPAFIAAALSGQAQERRAAVIAAFAPAKAERIEARLARSAAPSLAGAAVELLAATLEDAAPDPAATSDIKGAPQGWTGRWTARFRSLPWR